MNILYKFNLDTDMFWICIHSLIWLDLIPNIVQYHTHYKWDLCNHWRRLHKARGTCPLLLLQMAGHGGTVSIRTANKKLTTLYWPSRKRSRKRLIASSEPKMWRARQKICGVPHFPIRSGATVWDSGNGHIQTTLWGVGGDATPKNFGWAFSTAHANDYVIFDTRL